MFGSSPALGSQLLSTVGYTTGGTYKSSSPCDAFTFYIVHAGSHELGDILLGPWPPAFAWESGFTADYDLTSSLDSPPFSNFSRMTASLTDGVDDPVFFTGSVFDCAESIPNSPFFLESSLFGTESDLIGNTIDLIRLRVNDLSISSIDETTTYTLSATYEFWGTQSPEPASFLAMFCLLLFQPRKKPLR